MGDYRLYLTDEDGHVQRAIDHACSGDEEAREKARSLLGKYPRVEVWQGPRKIFIDKVSDGL